MKTILIGTNNPSKLSIMRTYLEGLEIQCVSPAEINRHDIPAETARTALDNAIAKAKAWHKASGLPVIAEDSGLVFIDLPEDHPDQPGVMVRRASGHTMDDDEMLAWYQGIIHRHGGKLRAAWADAWCVLQNEGNFATHVDSPQHLAQLAKLMVDVPCEKRLPGWPLDSLTYVPGCGKYKAEMTMEEMQAADDCASDVAKAHRAEIVAWLRAEVSKIV